MENELWPIHFATDGTAVNWSPLSVDELWWYIFSADWRRNFPGCKYWPNLEECVLAEEQDTERAFTAILNDGGAGSAEAVAAHAEWMIARTLRATMDALDDWRRWGYV